MQRVQTAEMGREVKSLTREILQELKGATRDAVACFRAFFGGWSQSRIKFSQLLFAPKKLFLPSLRSHANARRVHLFYLCTFSQIVINIGKENKHAGTSIKVCSISCDINPTFESSVNISEVKRHFTFDLWKVERSENFIDIIEHEMPFVSEIAAILWCCWL